MVLDFTRIGGGAALIGLAGLLASCGPTQSQIEQSIVDEYEEQGATDINVDLEPTDEGGYEGTVTYTDDETNEETERTCVVEPAESGESQWECNLSKEQFEEAIAADYGGRGATNVNVSLDAEDNGDYEGEITFTDPASGQQARHNCTVDVGEQANWECQP